MKNRVIITFILSSGFSILGSFLKVMRMDTASNILIWLGFAVGVLFLYFLSRLLLKSIKN